MDSRPSWSDARRQITYSCISLLIVIQAGINISFSSTLVPQLKKEYHITTDQESWIASLVALFVPVGALSSGFLMDKFGRKNVCRLLTLPVLLSWLLIGFSSGNYYVICLGRVLGGFASGLTTVTLVYISEISHKEYRSFLLGLNSVFYSVGILIVYGIGFSITWIQTSYVFMMCSAATFILLSFIPESPYWFKYFYDGDNKDVMIATAFKKLYGKKNFELYEHEMKTLLTKEPKLEKTMNIPWTEPTTYKPTLILLTIFILQQLSGAYVVLFYVVDILNEMGVAQSSNLNDNNWYLLIFGFIRLFFALISAIISRHQGRKRLMITSNLGMTMSLVCSIYLMLIKAEAMITFITVSGFLSFASFGVMVIPWTLIGELLSTEIRGKVGGLLFSATYLFMFAAVKVFPLFLAELGIVWILGFFAITSAISAVFVLCYLPETFKKSPEVISNFFNNKNELF